MEIYYVKYSQIMMITGNTVMIATLDEDNASWIVVDRIPICYVEDLIRIVSIN